MRQLPALSLPALGEASASGDCCAMPALLPPGAREGLMVRPAAGKAADWSQLDTLLDGDSWPLPLPCDSGVLARAEGVGCAPCLAGVAVAGRGARALVGVPGMVWRWRGVAEAEAGCRLGLHTGLAGWAADVPAVVALLVW